MDLLALTDRLTWHLCCQQKPNFMDTPGVSTPARSKIDGFQCRWQESVVSCARLSPVSRMQPGFFDTFLLDFTIEAWTHMVFECF